MKRKADIFLIVVFVLFITCPYLLAHRDREGRISDMENRTLAAYPSIQWGEGRRYNDYILDFENWLNDNLRGRTLMMEVNATLQYALFDRIVKTDALRGQEKWLFVNDDDMIREYQRLNLLGRESLEQYAENMQGIAEYLREKGIAFYYFQCYSKEEIYPEMYAPGIIQVGGKTSRADQIVGILQEKTDISQILVKEDLLAHKDEGIYYQFVDSLHWNEKGSYYGYQILMNQLHDDFPEIPVLQEEDFLVKEEETTVSLYGLDYPYTEICPIYTLADPHAVEITQDTQERWDFLHFKEHTHEYVNEECTNDLKILMLGDSFIRMFLKDDIAESFHGTLSIDWLNIPILDEIVEEYHPDIVIIESAQSALDSTIELVGETELE